MTINSRNTTVPQIIFDLAKRFEENKDAYAAATYQSLSNKISTNVYRGTLCLA